MLTCSASQRSALIVTTSLRSYYQNQSPGFSNICYSAKKIKKDRCFSSNLPSHPFRTGFYISHTHHGATLLKYHRCTTTGRYFKNRYPVCHHILKVLPPSYIYSSSLSWSSTLSRLPSTAIIPSCAIALISLDSDGLVTLR